MRNYNCIRILPIVYCCCYVTQLMLGYEYLGHAFTSSSTSFVIQSNNNNNNNICIQSSRYYGINHHHHYHYKNELYMMSSMDTNVNDDDDNGNETTSTIKDTTGISNDDDDNDDDDDSSNKVAIIEEEKEEGVKELLVSTNTDVDDTIMDTTTSMSTSTTTITTTTTATTKEEKLSFITSLGAITGRGEFMLQTKYRSSTQQQYKAIEKVVSELEDMNLILEPTLSSSHIYGTWELLFSTTHLFRHSPFFMAGRAVCTNNNDDIQKYNWFCDMHRAALAISQIQSVRQIITVQNQLVSEFEVKVGSIPFLSDFTPLKYSGGYPITITGAIVSSADLTPTPDGTGWEIDMDTVQIKGSNIPFLRTVLDNENVALQSRVVANALQQTISSYTTPPKPIFRTTYLDEQYRISRDVDDHIFVYVKTSNATLPTNYEFVDADFGIGRLLEGFNDVITKLYI